MCGPGRRLPLIGVNAKPFVIVNRSFDGSWGPGATIYFSETEKMKAQMATGIISVEFDFTYKGETTVASVVLTGTLKHAYGWYENNGVKYLVHMKIEGDIFPSLCTTPVFVNEASQVNPVVGNLGGGYRKIVVDENGSLSTKVL